jgi:hypothetical protein
LTYGKFNEADTESVVSGPLADNLQGRLSVRTERADGWQISNTRPDDRNGKVNNIIPGTSAGSDNDSLTKQLQRLQLPYIRDNYHELAQTSAEQQWGHIEYLQRLVDGEFDRREDLIAPQ